MNPWYLVIILALIDGLLLHNNMNLNDELSELRKKLGERDDKLEDGRR